MSVFIDAETEIQEGIFLRDSQMWTIQAACLCLLVSLKYPSSS